MLNELIMFLDTENDDLWGDDVCCLASKILHENRDENLKEIIRVWRDWPAKRQEHLAYILGESSSPLEKILLEEMMLSENEDVAYEAKESMKEYVRRNE